MRTRLVLLACALAAAQPACRRNQVDPSQFPPQGAPPGQYQPYGPYGQAQLPPGPQQGQLPTIPQTPVAPQPAPSPVGPPNPNDPITVIDVAWLRAEAGSVMGELIAALPPASQARVQNIPFFSDPTPGDVNAFAACDDQGQPLMAITDGLLEVEAYIAQLKATDELFGTRKVGDYENMIAQQAKPNQPLPRPAAGFLDPTQSADARKVARQHVLLDEQIAFVLGHELAHHHLGHTGCANGGGSKGISLGDVARALNRVAPWTNQSNEIAADVAGTNDALSAGAKRQGAKWNEEGALLTLDFFAVLDQLSPSAVILSFQNTHPHPLLRRPFVIGAAAAWRATGGQGVQLPNLGQFGL